MPILETVRWQLRAWGKLLSDAALYPFQPQSRREALVVGNAQVRKEYLPVVRLDAFTRGFDDADSIHLAALETRDHNCSLMELLTLATIARSVSPTRVLEVGTYDG